MALPLLLAAAASVPLLVAAPGDAASSASLPMPAAVFAAPGASASAFASHDLFSPALAGFRLRTLLQAEEAVRAELNRGGFPGAALAVGRRDKVVVEQGFGRMQWGAGSAPVDPDATVFDLASLTKVVATTTAVMLLAEDGRINLDARVSNYLPAFTGGGKEQVTIRHLLTHTSGLPAGAGLWGSPEEALARAISVPLGRPAGARVEYSDIGFIVLWVAAQSAAGDEPLYRLLDRRVFGPLQMRYTTFLPGERCDRCAPTAQRRDGTLLQGRVHDPLAQRLGGVAGHAGLFSTAHDLARFAAMLANGGELEGVRVLNTETIRRFTQRQPGSATRALGWDTPGDGASGAAGQRISRSGFGHTGFTGTSLWVDPDRGTWVVLLSNRVFEPQGANRIQALRRSVHDWVALSTDEAMASLQE
jgi:serine-type D-Ala-D-Ala carboxypeptidase